MRYRFAVLLALLLCTSAAQAQLITDPARATAARDTLLHEAQRLRLVATQNTPFFVSNGRHRNPRRVQVTGTFAPKPTVLVRSVVDQRVLAIVTWEHITRYRRNGQVQEKFRIWYAGDLLLDERRLDGTVRWLSLPASGAAGGLPARHLGLYLQTGYLYCDGAAYVLLSPPPR